MTVVVGAASDQGRVRTNNEDSFVVLVPPGLPEGLDAVLVVADGMGGHQAGEVASRLVISRFETWFRAETGPQRIDADLDLAALLARIIQEANEAVFSLASEDPRLFGMGTTVVAAAVARQRIFLGYVGDSRAYLIDDANVYQLNHDHSWVAEEVRAGRLTPAQARTHPRRNILTRAVGVGPVVEVETQAFEIGDGDRLLLCTDGLSNLVVDAELQQIVCQHDDPADAAQRLIQLANQRGSPDNVTVVVARYHATASTPRRRNDETLPARPMAR